MERVSEDALLVLPHELTSLVTVLLDSRARHVILPLIFADRIHVTTLEHVRARPLASTAPVPPTSLRTHAR